MENKIKEEMLAGNYNVDYEIIHTMNISLFLI